MAPTLVFAPNGELFLSIGSSGGTTIPTNVAQAIVHLIDDQMPIDRAIGAPRLHHNLFPDLVRVEPNGMEQATARALEARGHVLRFGEEHGHETEDSFFASTWGKACAVLVHLEHHWRMADCDPRYHGGGAVP
jgi:gamma-glutamyltranspeptidase/glutathione hydrolase